MPISQLAEPCWVLEPEGGPDGEDWQHWTSEASAREGLKDSYPAEDYPAGTVTVLRRAEGCWTITCDGECGEGPEDDEYANIHCTSRTEAEQYATACDWIVTRDGEVYCEDDAPDRSTADLAVTEQIPGQLTIDGEEAPGA